VAELLDADVEVVPIRTAGEARRGEGDRGGDKSRFVKEIEDALLREEVNLAVHSAKDVPSQLPEGLSIVGVPERADPRDALCGGFDSLDSLPEGAVVGTGSLRRRAQLLARRPDLRVEGLRGNVDTRLRRLREGDYEALVLAAAGLERLGLPDGVPLAASEFTPAGGQGCLALEARADDGPMRELCAAATHRPSLQALMAERALIGALDASCRTPLAAHAEHRDGQLVLSSFAGLPDGSTWIRDTISGATDDPAALGRAAAERLIAAGADELLREADRA
jgi:hydroxymethylbilane synthase